MHGWLVFRELGQRFPDKVVAYRMGEAMKDAFENHEKRDDRGLHFTVRSRLVFARLQSEGVNLPSEVREYILLCGC